MDRERFLILVVGNGNFDLSAYHRDFDPFFYSDREVIFRRLLFYSPEDIEKMGIINQMSAILLVFKNNDSSKQRRRQEENWLELARFYRLPLFVVSDDPVNSLVPREVF